MARHDASVTSLQPAFGEEQLAPLVQCWVVSELWAVYSGRVALVLFGGWRAVLLLPRRPLTEALIEMAEQRALHRGLRHVVVGAA